MATGASTAHLALLLVDATKGVLPQTRRHAFIASLLGIPRLLVAVNKMDLVDYAEPVFDAIAAELREFAARLGPLDLRLVPVAARDGVNLVTRDDAAMPWYTGESVVEVLESVYVGGDRNLVDLRLAGAVRDPRRRRHPGAGRPGGFGRRAPGRRADGAALAGGGAGEDADRLGRRARPRFRRTP